jgi:hypothetical protein
MPWIACDAFEAALPMRQAAVVVAIGRPGAMVVATSRRRFTPPLSLAC